jgi:hypothetical protein
LETLTWSVTWNTFEELMRWSRDKAAYILHLHQTTEQVTRGDDDPRVLEARSGDWSPVDNIIGNVFIQHRFILTKRGYTALVPRVAREGDVLAFIYGCTGPTILRHTEQGSQYQSLGPAKVVSKRVQEDENGGITLKTLGTEGNRDWEERGVKDQKIYLC